MASNFDIDFIIEYSIPLSPPASPDFSTPVYSYSPDSSTPVYSYSPDSSPNSFADNYGQTPPTPQSFSENEEEPNNNDNYLERLVNRLRARLEQQYNDDNNSNSDSDENNSNSDDDDLRDDFVHKFFESVNSFYDK